jgi:His-Xaa-Ser system radical SAM maturase HxsC
MNRHISGYNDDYYIFKVCFNNDEHIRFMQTGLNHIFKLGDEIRLYTYDGYIIMPESAEIIFDEFNEDDVLSIDEMGIICHLFRSDSDDNAIVFTMQCNSNCVMCPCSEASRKNGFLSSSDYIKELLRYIPEHARYLTLTGGEPTLLKEDFFEVMEYIRDTRDKTHFQLLTNGRAFGDYSFTQRFIECLPDNIELGIPLYGYNEATHDAITQAPGSFKQTVIGIHNLLHYNIDVELRIVLTKLNIDYIDKVAAYIIKYLGGVRCVNFMGLELMGNAAKNMDKVWLPYEVMAEKSEKAIRMLIEHGMDVKLYNFPLCAVKKEYWVLCAKSISDYKIDYDDICSQCMVREICGGIFDSTKRMAKITGKPILENLIESEVMDA